MIERLGGYLAASQGQPTTPPFLWASHSKTASPLQRLTVAFGHIGKVTDPHPSSCCRSRSVGLGVKSEGHPDPESSRTEGEISTGAGVASQLPKRPPRVRGLEMSLTSSLPLISPAKQL